MRLMALKGAFPFADADSNSGTAPESYLAAPGRPSESAGLGERVDGESAGQLKLGGLGFEEAGEVIVL